METARRFDLNAGLFLMGSMKLFQHGSFRNRGCFGMCETLLEYG